MYCKGEFVDVTLSRKPYRIFRQLERKKKLWENAQNEVLYAQKMLKNDLRLYLRYFILITCTY